MSQVQASSPETAAVADFIARWSGSGAAERSNYQLFLRDLCDVIAAPHPEPAQADSAHNTYVFEHPVRFDEGTTRFIDLYRRGAFVLEAKQGSDREKLEDETGLRLPKRARRGTAVRGTAGWDDAMLAARGQAEMYARNLPETDELPPFLVVVDVGHSIELYADFARAGKSYTAFPDASSHRIYLRDLADPKIRERLRLVWTNPLELDPSRRSAKVTREVASRLAELARSFERSGHEPQRVAHFLMRCLFTMFAEDVGLLKPKGCFTALLKGRRGKLDTFPDMLGSLWQTMDKGGFSPILERSVLRFNGELFANSEALPVTAAQLELLIHAAEANWESVEPAIFGTLLERALDPVERHKLGAHYTPRAYVERLVLPTIVEPLREEWEAAKTAAVALGRAGKIKEARAEVDAFLDRLCSVTVLDPACGTGNLTLEHLKRLEGEARDVLRGFGETQEDLEWTGRTVDPHQLLGIELNPRAAAIAELVLWIGYLQWHFRTFGARMPAEPIIKAFHNIECRDAVLAYDHAEPVLDEAGAPVTRWDGRTMKTHPVTGEPVPDESAQIPVLKYVNPRKAEWPRADFIIGNPPFIGASRMRDLLGVGCAEAVRKAHPEVADSSDYVMYWWNNAAHLVRKRLVQRFGLITTNSLKQNFNRRVVEPHLAATDPLSLDFAIPDHPWVDAADGAAVRIAMTVGVAGSVAGTLRKVIHEVPSANGDSIVTLTEHSGDIHADLTIGADISKTTALKSNSLLSSEGLKPHGMGFIVTPKEAASLGLGRIAGLESCIRPYRNGRDLTARCRNIMVIDLHGLTASQVRDMYPEVYQWVLNRVKPERDHNNMKYRRENWWLFGGKSTELRAAISGLPQYIVTVKTSRHRFFTFLESPVLPDSKLIVIASDAPLTLGILSSKIHLVWALALGSHLGVGNDPTYVKSMCFERYPFPETTEDQSSKISALASRLDAHRKRQQAQHPTLTLTDMYNVLEKLRSGEALSGKEKVVHEQGLVSVLKQIHDDLDAAVFAAYGWPAGLSDDEILTRLVALNAERAEEEARGLVRWLRPEFQNPAGRAAASSEAQGRLIDETDDGEATPPPAARAKGGTKTPWPKTLAEQAQAVRAALSAHRGPVSAGQLAKTFARARVDRIEELLEALASLGQARELPDGRFAPPVASR